MAWCTATPNINVCLIVKVCSMHVIESLFNVLKYRIEVDRLGTRRYYNSAGQVHRDEGPAVEHASGINEWCQNGVLHRKDGPAIDFGSGGGLWFIHGRRCSKKEHSDWVLKGAV